MADPVYGVCYVTYGAHSVSGGTAPVITECHPGRPWGIERTFHL